MVPSVSKPDMIVFDVDGVLVDASRSYPEVVSRALLWGWTRVLGNIPDSEGFSYRHFSATKTHHAFNDDYDIAWAALNCAASRGTPSLAASLPSPEEWRSLLDGCTGTDIVSWVRSAFGETVLREPLRQACEEMYFGWDEYEAMGEIPLYTTRRAGLGKKNTLSRPFRGGICPSRRVSTPAGPAGSCASPSRFWTGRTSRPTSSSRRRRV